MDTDPKPKTVGGNIVELPSAPSSRRPFFENFTSQIPNRAPTPPERLLGSGVKLPLS